jgi:hypothetical protein
MATDNKWMNDEALKDISHEKLDFLNKVFVQSGAVDKTNQKEMLSFLLSINKLSKNNSISFKKDEIDTIFNVLKKYSTSEDIAKMEKIFNLYYSRCQ